MFGDVANVQGESFCWHLAGDVLYPVHESEGQSLAIHSWATKNGLLKGSTHLWDVGKDGANNHLVGFVFFCFSHLSALR